MVENTDQFIVTARKWRPMHFHEMVGQDHVGTTLRNAVTGGRIHHAYLFTGPRGVGKTTTARLLAKSLNCLSSETEGEPCNKCESCKDIVEGRSLDVVEIDGASNNSVDDIRKLRDSVKYPPIHGKYKVYIIDEVHMLSSSAFNALLKTLEEPPPHLLFIFATTEVHKVPATILSRCQRFDFRRMEIETIVTQLSKIANAEGIVIDNESLLAIAKKADGSMRDSQSIFDQVVAFCGNTITSDAVHNALHLIDEEFFFSITKAIHHHDVAHMFHLAQMVNEKGYEVQECLNGLLEHLRNLLTVLATGETKLIESSTLYIERYEREAVNFTQSDVIRLMTIVTNTQQEIRFSTQPRFRFELMLSQMATMDSTVLISDLLDELKNGVKTQSNVIQPSNTPTPQIATTAVKEQSINYTPNVQKLEVTVQPEIVNKVEKKDEPVMKSIDYSVLKDQWSEFVENLTDTGLKMLFQFRQNDYKLQFFDGEIVITSLQKLFYTSIEKNIQSIEQQATSFFDSPIRISLKTAEEKNIEDMFEIKQEVKQGISDSKSVINEPVKTSTMEKLSEMMARTEEAKPQKVQKEYHPLEQAIMSLFGAREIPLIIQK